ncbi:MULTISPECIES: hypothetical protein [Megasphaera]|uniref:Uncharacterized protein n=1 Tax=Megasphaera vaginalis (ex Srinivasan et al. 2021) TaxID=1111454 RepID=U7UNG0_9FIRM|nr:MULTISPECIES: hypothetical protein [Megasphaera]ERT60023.1 hypothetical protein HMPREF1250_0869 [Megasphaera vaginalis (ex Srinivasan et al. 2021)]
MKRFGISLFIMTGFITVLVSNIILTDLVRGTLLQGFFYDLMMAGAASESCLLSGI